MSKKLKGADGDIKVGHTFKIKKSLLKECQNAVAFCSGYPSYLSMSQFVEEAMTRQLEHMKKLKKDELKDCGGCFPDPPSIND